LCDALTEALGATILAPDLDGDEVGAGIADVVRLWSDEVERRIPGWVSPGEARTDTDPEVPTEEKPMRNPLSGQDQQAIELSKMTRRDPELRERVRIAEGSQRRVELRWWLGSRVPCSLLSVMASAPISSFLPDAVGF
jgi:hypothetical protein